MNISVLIFSILLWNINTDPPPNGRKWAIRDWKYRMEKQHWIVEKAIFFFIENVIEILMLLMK